MCILTQGRIQKAWKHVFSAACTIAFWDFFLLSAARHYMKLGDLNRGARNQMSAIMSFQKDFVEISMLEDILKTTKDAPFP